MNNHIVRIGSNKKNNLYEVKLKKLRYYKGSESFQPRKYKMAFRFILHWISGIILFVDGDNKSDTSVISDLS